MPPSGLLRARIHAAPRLSSIEFRFAPIAATNSGTAGYANGHPTGNTKLKNRIQWPTTNAIPAALGVAAKSMAELKTLSMQEQQAFHRAALARLRACLGMGWAMDTGAGTGAGAAVGDGSSTTAGADTVPTDAGESSRNYKYRLGSRSSRLKQALHLAHLLLSGPPASAKAEPSTAPRLARCALYTRLISAFCGAGYAQVGLELLNRQKREELELNPRDVSMVLKGLVAGVGGDTATEGGTGAGGTDGSGGVAVLEEIVPLLPEGLDTVLLTQVVRVMVTHTQCGPEEVKDIIARCLRSMDGEGEAPSEVSQLKAVAGAGGALDMGDMEDWDWGLWDVYLSSFRGTRGTKGWKQAMSVLGKFCRAVGKERQRRIEHPPKDGSLIWTEHDIDLIQRPFITVLSLFTSSSATPREARVSRRDSNIPRQLVHDYLALINARNASTREEHVSPRPMSAVSLELANVWMNAERIVGHREIAEDIWTWISGMTVDGHAVYRRAAADKLGIPATAVGELPLGPDSFTYQTLFKLLAQANRYPSPSLIHRFLDTSVAITTSSLNAALSSLLHFTPPIPLAPNAPGTRAPLSQYYMDQTRERLILAYQLLRAFSSLSQRHSHTSPSPPASTPVPVLPEHEWRITERTIDIIAAGLVKLWRAGAPIFPEEERHKIPEPPAALQARRQARDEVSRHGDHGYPGKNVGKGDGKGVRTGDDGLPLWVSRAEWELVADELHRIRLGAFAAPKDGQGNPGDSNSSLTSDPGAEMPRRIDLPLRRPTARTDNQVQLSLISSSATSITTWTGTANGGITKSTEHGRDTGLSVLFAQPSTALLKARAMQKPLMRLIGRALQKLGEAHEEVRSERGDHGGNDDVGIGEEREHADLSVKEAGGSSGGGEAKWYGRHIRAELAWLKARISREDIV